MPEKKRSQKKNLRRWLSSWPAYIIGKARQGLSLAHLPVGTVVSTVRLGHHSVGKTLAFCPLCLKYFSSGHSHSQDIWNRRWHWFGSSGAVHYVHLQSLLAGVAETWLGSWAGGVQEVHDLPPDFLTWEGTLWLVVFLEQQDPLGNVDSWSKIQNKN